MRIKILLAMFIAALSNNGYAASDENIGEEIEEVYSPGVYRTFSDTSMQVVNTPNYQALFNAHTQTAYFRSNVESKVFVNVNILHQYLTRFGISHLDFDFPASDFFLKGRKDVMNRYSIKAKGNRIEVRVDDDEIKRIQDENEHAISPYTPQRQQTPVFQGPSIMPSPLLPKLTFEDPTLNSLSILGCSSLGRIIPPQTFDVSLNGIFADVLQLRATGGNIEVTGGNIEVEDNRKLLSNFPGNIILQSEKKEEVVTTYDDID